MTYFEINDDGVAFNEHLSVGSYNALSAALVNDLAVTHSGRNVPQKNRFG